jgi:hypothetical protein
MRGDRRASGGRCSSIFRRRQQIIGRKWPVIYWALYLFRGRYFCCGRISIGAALKWQSAGAQSRKEMASLWLRLKANKWVQLFLARTLKLRILTIHPSYCPPCVRMRAYPAQKDCRMPIAHRHYPCPMILIAFSGVNLIHSDQWKPAQLWNWQVIIGKFYARVILSCNLIRRGKSLKIWCI